MIMSYSTSLEQVFDYTFYVGVDDGLLSCSALEILEVCLVVHEEVFCEDGRAECFLEEGEVLFPVAVAV